MSVPGLTEDALAVGMPVYVFRNHGRDALEPVPGEITKVGRTLVTVATGPDAHQRTQYRIDGQSENTDRGYASRFLTLPQMAEQDLRTHALDRLRACGLAPMTTYGSGAAYRPLILDTEALVRLADALPEDPTP